MTNNQKLKGLVAILFILIVVLVGLLIYATTVYKPGVPAADTAASTASVSSGAEQTPGGNTGAEENMELELYKYSGEDYDNPKEIVKVTVSRKLYDEDLTAAINKVLEASGLSISKAVLDGDFITVDLKKEVAAKFNIGSAGGITNTNILAMTVLNLPKVEKLEITVEGQHNVEGDHFSFNGIFTKSADGKKYQFAMGDTQGKLIDF